MDTGAKTPVKIYGNDSLSSKIATYQKRAEEHRVKQRTNPFSQSGSVSDIERPKWDKSDPRYGRPPEGSKTEQRGQAASSHISNEVVFLCEIMHEYGTQNGDGTVAISFGELFQLYTTISNKLVGMLMRARKHGLVHFESEMLFQRRDDDEIITLLKPIDEIRPPRTSKKRRHDADEEPMDFAISPEDY